MWSVYLGLVMTWRDRILQLIVESDLKFLIDAIAYKCNPGVPLFPFWWEVFAIYWVWTGRSKLFIFCARETEVLS